MSLGSLNIPGAMDDNYLESFDIPLSSMQWSTCRRRQNLQVDTTIRLRTPQNSSAYITVDSIDGSITNQLGIIWRNCDPKQRMNFVAICTQKRQWMRNNRLRQGRSVVRAVGKTRPIALQKAKDKAAKRCSTRAQKRGGSCQGVPVCQVSPL